MSRLSKLKILFFIETIILSLQFYGLYYINNDASLSQLFLICLMGTVATIGITVLTILNIKWDIENLKIST